MLYNAKNHGFAVDAETLPTDWLPLFVNTNDGTSEGTVHVSRPWLSGQFHPEACGGPTVSSFLFEYFGKSILDPALPVSRKKERAFVAQQRPGFESHRLSFGLCGSEACAWV